MTRFASIDVLKTKNPDDSFVRAALDLRKGEATVSHRSRGRQPRYFHQCRFKIMRGVYSSRGEVQAVFSPYAAEACGIDLDRFCWYCACTVAPRGAHGYNNDPK